MKKGLKTIIVCILLLTMLPLNVFAAENPDSTEEIIYLEDGSYITVKTELIPVRANQTKSGKKTYTYNTSSGSEEWRAVLTGTFTYTGTTSTCTASSCTVSITNTNWYQVSKTVGKSGSTATADLTMGCKFLGITVIKHDITLTLTCDANGNLS